MHLHKILNIPEKSFSIQLIILIIVSSLVGYSEYLRNNNNLLYGIIFAITLISYYLLITYIKNIPPKLLLMGFMAVNLIALKIIVLPLLIVGIGSMWGIYTFLEWAKKRDISLGKKFVWLGFFYMLFIGGGILLIQYPSLNYQKSVTPIWGLIFAALYMKLPIYIYETHGKKKGGNSFQDFLLYTILGPLSPVFIGSLPVSLYSEFIKGYTPRFDVKLFLSGFGLIAYSALVGLGLRTGFVSKYLGYIQEHQLTALPYILIYIVLGFIHAYMVIASWAHSIIGIARVWGFNIKPYMRYPFVATSFIDFFHRWLTCYRDTVLKLVYYPIVLSMRKHQTIAPLIASVSCLMAVAFLHTCWYFIGNVYGGKIGKGFIGMNTAEYSTGIYYGIILGLSFMVTNAVWFKQLKEQIQLSSIKRKIYLITTWSLTMLFQGIFFSIGYFFIAGVGDQKAFSDFINGAFQANGLGFIKYIFPVLLLY